MHGFIILSLSPLYATTSRRESPLDKRMRHTPCLPCRWRAGNDRWQSRRAVARVPLDFKGAVFDFFVSSAGSTLQVFQGGKVHVHPPVYSAFTPLAPTPVLRHEMPQWYDAPSDRVERARKPNSRWTTGWATRLAWPGSRFPSLGPGNFSHSIAAKRQAIEPDPRGRAQANGNVIRHRPRN